MVDKVRRYTPRPLQAAPEAIEAYILKNQMKANDKFPPERTMCQMWGLNRSTLRSTLARMARDGRVHAVQGSGTCFTPRVDRVLQDLKSFTQYAADLGMKPETRLLGLSMVECDKQLARRFQRVLGDKLYRVIRLRMLDGMPLMIETAYIPAALTPGLEERDLVGGSLFAIMEENYHLIMHHGYERISITTTTPEEANYLGTEAGVPAFWIVSEVYGDDGALIEYCRTIGRCDRMQMSSTLYWIGGGDEG